MARVLIIEDEILLRAAMARGIAKMPGIFVAEAATFGEALASIDEHAPQMIVSDIDLPDRSGVELPGELGRRGLHIPILYVSAYLKAYAAQIPRHADIDVREKPLRLEELRSIIENRLAANAPVDDEPFAPADYLQLACLGHRSVVIEIDCGQQHGTIVVQEGTLWTASDTRGSGPAAFGRLAFIPGALVRVRALREDPGPRTIHGSWEQVLLEAAREHDEASMRGDSLRGDPVHGDSVASFDHIEFESQRDKAGGGSEPGAPRQPLPTLPSGTELESFLEMMPPQLEAPPPPPPPEPEITAFDEAFEAGVEALLGKDYTSAYAAFERAGAIRPEDAKVVTNLERLRQLGHGPSAQKAS